MRTIPVEGEQQVLYNHNVNHSSIKLYTVAIIAGYIVVPSPGGQRREEARLLRLGVWDLCHLPRSGKEGRREVILKSSQARNCRP